MPLLFIIIRNRIARDQDGASMVEYALLIGLIAIVVLAGAVILGTALNIKFSEFGNSVG